VLPAHLVLGLLSEPDALAAKAIAATGTPLQAVRAAAVAVLPPAQPDVDVPDLIPYDHTSRKVLEVTFREALRLGHNYIGTEHILLALLEVEPDAGLLAGLGVEKPVIESHVLDALGKHRR
jgi:ATP-dependent Clp protease ATP-binding subunit ClpA